MNRIGLDQNHAIELGLRLNSLLANYQIFYMNVRGFHWNIKGQKFFELHTKFEELYDDLLIKIDEIAERVLTLGQVPLHAYSDYLEQSEIAEVKNASGGGETVRALLTGLETLIKKQRAILNLSADADDEGTNALMSDYVREQEKLIWMYSAFLSTNGD